ncbi:hypothetical protein GcM3_084018 [Golovinomyces cichoracearum]|uniref:Uncharacterized protein n=1 Tax=Golovinomyces cichoracearum TaxID=62708 RepID=A0A420ILI8_9PEZI|nr:hypothetical protein GcM3_084018 [Golovinomyces cichoracearum]
MSYNFNAESKKYNRRIDPRSASENDISGYTKFKTELYKREEWSDEDLWETFTYDFEKFNLDNWKMTFYTDQKFRRRHDINNSRPNERRFNSSIQPSGKNCFVRHKGGYWSSRHTQEERDESYQKSKQKFGNKLDKSLKKRFEHSFAEYEGDELDEIPENNLDDENFDVLLAGIELHYTSSDETFLTSAGPIDGKSIISNLANCSFLHGITGKLETNQSSTIRYGNREFCGIMIDTAAEKSLERLYGG